MSADILTTIAIGIALFATHITTFIYLLRRMDKLSDRVAALEVELKGSISSLEVKMTERIARLEGITIGRQEVSGNGGAPSPAGDD